jgi:Rab-GTPase-TBC domain
MTTDYFTSKWIMTVFACFLPYEQLPGIFDMFLMDGWRAVFRIGIALLRQMENRLLEMDMVEMCSYFRDNVRKERVASDFKLFSEAARVRVNPILVFTYLKFTNCYRYTTGNSKSSKNSSTLFRPKSNLNQQPAPGNQIRSTL